MTLEILNTIAQFLQRARLDGSEVQAFNACMAALEAERYIDMLTGGL